MDSISTFFYSVAVAQMLFCAMVLIARSDKSQLAYFYIALLVSGSIYVLGKVFSLDEYLLLNGLTFIAGNSLLGIFWLVSLCLFSDHIKVGVQHYVIASLPLLLPCLVLFSAALLGQIPRLEQVSKALVMLIELAMVCHALTITLRYWRDDLIEQRRFLRASLISFSGVYFLLVIVLEQVLQLQANWLTQLESSVLAGLTLFLNFFLLQLRELSLFPAKAAAQPPRIKKKKYSAEVERILAMMTEKAVYQQEGLTITALARQLNIYEYKLRNAINGELGYRNFNDFLNYYRIKEVTAKLQDPANSSIAILNLALDSGFRSLSSFNKAFKDTHHLTPSEYRKRFGQAAD